LSANLIAYYEAATLAPKPQGQIDALIACAIGHTPQAAGPHTVDR